MEETKKMKLNIMTPETEFLNTEVEAVNFSLEDGSYEILPGHTPIAMSLTLGSISYKKNGEWHSIWSTEGIAKVIGDEILVFTNRCAEAENALSMSEKKHFEMMATQRESNYQHRESKISIARTLTGLRKKKKHI